MSDRARAVVFDMDGTLVDNMRLHAQAWVEISRRIGSERPQAFFETETAGKKNVEILAVLLGPGASEERVAALAEEKEALYRESCRSRLAPVAGARELLERLRSAGVPLAVATLAPRENRELVLDGLELRRYFAAVIGPEQMARGKPHPDIFLAAARALDVPPHACLACEDAVHGVAAARSAGMDVLAVTTTASEAALRAAGARWIVADFASLPQDFERRLFA